MGTQGRIARVYAELTAGSGHRDLIADFKSGWIDSLLFIRFVTMLEKEFGVAFGPSDLDDDVFADMTTLARVVDEKRAVAS